MNIYYIDEHIHEVFPHEHYFTQVRSYYIFAASDERALEKARQAALAREYPRKLHVGVYLVSRTEETKKMIYGIEVESVSK